MRPFISLRALAALSCSSIGFGLAEALVLVMIARIAFALSKGIDTISGEALGLHVTMSINEALWFTAALVGFRAAVQVLSGWQSSRIVTHTLARARKRIARAYLQSSWEIQAQEPQGRLQELTTNFVGVAGSVVDALTKGITSVFSLVALLGTALLVSPLAALGFAATAVILGSTLKPLRQVLRKHSRRVADVNLEFAAGISEMSSIGREAQVFDVVQPLNERIDDLVDRSAHTAQRQSFLGFLFTPAYTTAMLIVLLLALVVVRATGLSDLEQLSAVMLVMLRSLAYGQLAQAVFATLQSTLPFAEDLWDQITTYERHAVDRSATLPVSRGRVEFDAVSYSYPTGASRPALRDSTFSIEPGELTGIIGPSGSGKSTLVQLLLRLRLPTEGVIRLDGVDSTGLSLREWRKGVTFVPQEPRIIAGTISDNIRFYRSIDFERVREAARAAHIHDEIMSLPDGYETVLGGGGAHLSGGQQQRLCIARALATDPWMLILDEPTSALDVFSEARIRETLAGLSTSVSVVVVAHRLSTIRECDRIMVIQDGELTAFDTPDALQATGGFYKDALAVAGLK